jgi:hypothetical protein
MTGYTPVTNHHESPTEPTASAEPAESAGPTRAGDVEIAPAVDSGGGDGGDGDGGDGPGGDGPGGSPGARELVDIPAVEVISRAVVMLMSAAAEQLGLASDDPDAPAHRDLDQARTLIIALAGLVNAAAPELGPHAAAYRDGLAALQAAFREYSVHPDEPGQGPGERARR